MMSGMNEECIRLHEDLVALAGTREPVPDALRLHLEACPLCRKEWERFAGDWERLGVDRVDARPMEGFLEEVRRRLVHSLRRRVRGAAAAAVLLLALAAFFLWGNGVGEEAEPVRDGLLSLSEEDREVVENIELLTDLDLLLAMEGLELDEIEYEMVKEETR